MKRRSAFQWDEPRLPSFPSFAGRSIGILNEMSYSLGRQARTIPSHAHAFLKVRCQAGGCQGPRAIGTRTFNLGHFVQRMSEYIDIILVHLLILILLAQR